MNNDEFPDIIADSAYLEKALEKRRQLYLRIDKAMAEYDEATKRGETVLPPVFEAWEMERYRIWKTDRENNVE